MGQFLPFTHKTLAQGKHSTEFKFLNNLQKNKGSLSSSEAGWDDFGLSYLTMDSESLERGFGGTRQAA